MPSCAADSWRYRSCNAACTVLALRSPRRTSASMRVRRAATSANSAATKNAFASTSATSAARRRPSDSVADPDIEAGTYPVVTRLQAPPFDVLAPYLPTRGAAADPETATAVRAIIEDVRARGDAAVVDHARRLDGVELAPEQWEVSGARCEEALARIPRALRAALELAAARVRAYHEKQVEPGFLERDAEGTALGMRVVPLERVGVYVPGGKAAYPSTVIMNTVPAVVAGVPEIVMVTPPGGTPDVVLAAARLAGVTRVFRVGGAQAIAALAFGARPVARSPRRVIVERSLADHGVVVVVPDLDAAVEVANRRAPEHVELLVGGDPWPLVERIRHAGAIFVGGATPEPVGDYVAGPSHVLPTAGTARYVSPLGVYDFVKRTSVIAYAPKRLAQDAEHIIALAEAEGLYGHAEAIRVRGERGAGSGS